MAQSIVPHTTGVQRDHNRWEARIRCGGRQQHLGRFNTAEEAAKAYDEEAKRRWTNPILNFLPDGSINPDRHKVTGMAFMLRSGVLHVEEQHVRRPSGKEEDRDGSIGDEEETAAAAAAAAAEEEEDEEGGSISGRESEGAGGGGKQRASFFRG
jgi:hypothetical protein